MNFKVGSWVKDKERLCPPFKLCEKDFNMLLGYEFLSQHFELWQPKKGEWCWFYDSKKTDQFILARFDREDKHVYPYVAEGGGRFSYCEPFIDKLPNT